MNAGHRTAIHTTNAPSPAGGYSQATVGGGLLWVSGQIPLRPDGTMVEGSLGAQARQAFANLAAIVEESGASMESVLRVGVHLSDLAHFEDMDRVFREVFEEPRPARTTVQVGLLGCDIEIDAIALPE